MRGECGISRSPPRLRPSCTSFVEDAAAEPGHPLRAIEIVAEEAQRRRHIGGGVHEIGIAQPQQHRCERVTLGDLTERERSLFVDMMQRIVAGNANRDSTPVVFN